MKHELEIKSLHDAHAVCSCGRWAFSATGERTREEIEREFARHLEAWEPRPDPGTCICTRECDCQDFEAGFVSNECPEHNDRPYPHPDCEAEKHWWQES